MSGMQMNSLMGMGTAAGTNVASALAPKKHAALVSADTTTAGRPRSEAQRG